MRIKKKFQCCSASGHLRRLGHSALAGARGKFDYFPLHIQWDSDGFWECRVHSESTEDVYSEGHVYNRSAVAGGTFFKKLGHEHTEESRRWLSSIQATLFSHVAPGEYPRSGLFTGRRSWVC